ncbi:MAG: electron transfer flavoprotein alpha subunit [Thermoleophilaceae bacterium]|nr:electron transfer flavoprotein alpha subunit [Thermoleophilaceae bacterium]
MSVLIVAEHLRGEVRDVTRELIAAGREIGGPVAVVVIAKDPAAMVDAVNLDGVDEVITVPVEQEEFENDVWQRAVEALIAERRPRMTLLGFTASSMGYAPAVAVKLGIGFATDVLAVGLEGDAVVAQRSFYGGKVHAEIEFPGTDGVLLLLRLAGWPAAEGAGSATVTEFQAPAGASRARHQRLVEPDAGGVDIATADFLLSLGRGIGEKDAIEQFDELAGKMGATLSASRPLVDAGWVGSERQVGQSGKTVKPKVYLAFGISGAVQHLAGMKQSETIIAVNSDPEATIFNQAHFGAVADLFEVADELEKLY